MSTQRFQQMGDLFLNANAVDAAIDSYQKAVQHGTQNGELFLSLALAYMRTGHIVESIQHYEKSLILLPTKHERAVVYTKIGECYRQLQDFDQAIASFRCAIELEPGNPRLCDGLADVQRDLEKLYSFQTVDEQPFGQVGIISPQVISDPVLQSEPEINQNQISPATRNSGVVEIHPSGVMDEVETDSAKILPTELVEQHFGNLNMRNDESISESMQMVPPFIQEEGPIVAPTVENPLHDNEIKDGQVDISAAMEAPSLERAENSQDELDKEGVRVTMLLTLGIIYWRNGSLEDAKDTLQSSVEGAQKISNAWIEALSWHALALVQTALADIHGAISSYLKAVELAPEQIFPWNNVGTLYRSLGNNDKALNSFLKAIQKNPQDAESWDGLGDIYTRLGRVDDAIAAYQLGNMFDPSSIGVDVVTSYEKAMEFYKLTVSSLNGNDQSFPDQDTKSTVETKPQSDKSIEEEASLHVMDLYEKFMETNTIDQINPTAQPAVSAGADEMVEPEIASIPNYVSDEKNGAQESLSPIVPTDVLVSPNIEDTEVFASQSETLINEPPSIFPVENQSSHDKNGREESQVNQDEGMLPIVSVDSSPRPNPSKVVGTIATWEATVRENPYNDRAWDQLGNLYRIVQRNAEAISAFEKAVSLEPNKYVYHYQLGTLYAAEGNFQDAIRQIQIVVELNPEFTFAHCALASYLRRVGQDEQAAHHVSIAAPYIKNEKEYDRACFESIRGNVDGALELLKVALEKKQTTIDWIQRDQDLDFIRQDPRYVFLTSKPSQSLIGH